MLVTVGAVGVNRGGARAAEEPGVDGVPQPVEAASAQVVADARGGVAGPVVDVDPDHRGGAGEPETVDVGGGAGKDAGHGAARRPADRVGELGQGAGDPQLTGEAAGGEGTVEHVPGGARVRERAGRGDGGHPTNGLSAHGTGRSASTSRSTASPSCSSRNDVLSGAGPTRMPPGSR